jgi:hypothetical protein
MSKSATETPRTRTSIDSEAFVQAWLKAETIRDVCDTMDIEVGSAHTKATSLRKLGVKLPKLAHIPRSPTVDVSALNKLIKAASNGQ